VWSVHLSKALLDQDFKEAAGDSRGKWSQGNRHINGLSAIGSNLPKAEYCPTLTDIYTPDKADMLHRNIKTLEVLPDIGAHKVLQARAYFLHMGLGVGMGAKRRIIT
jgi:hypothetical protein